MDLFKKKSRVIEVGGQKIELQPKPKTGLLSFLNSKPSKAPSNASGTSTSTFAPPSSALKQAAPSSTQQPQQIAKQLQQAPPQKNTEKKSILGTLGGYAPKAPSQPETQGPKLSFKDIQINEATKAQTSVAPGVKGIDQTKKFQPPSRWKKYVESIGAKQKGLETILRDQGIKSTLYDFVQRMLIAAIMLTVVLTITIYILFTTLGLSSIESLIFALVLGIAIFQGSLRTFLQYPFAKKKNNAKLIERDILFAARDMIISLRSGMPLFNSITSISTGYGDASKEFAKVVERVQLGMPLEEAIDAVIAQTQSASFRKIMLQASVSIKAGADVVTALQSVIDQLSQERIIELRSYGQRLNALAMFYMLFGVILPSMGIAVITILTTFIAIFTVDNSVLEFVLVGILFLQVLFLQLIRRSRPVFSM